MNLKRIYIAMSMIRAIFKSTLCSFKYIRIRILALRTSFILKRMFQDIKFKYKHYIRNCPVGTFSRFGVQNLSYLSLTVRVIWLGFDY